MLQTRQSLILRLRRRRPLTSRKRQPTPKQSKPRRMLPRLRSRQMLTRHLPQQLRPLVAMQTSQAPRAQQQHLPRSQQLPQRRARLRRPSRISRRRLRTRSRRPQRRPSRLLMTPRSNLKNLPSKLSRRAKMPPRRPLKRPSKRQISKINRKLLPLPQLLPLHQHRPPLHQLSPLHLFRLPLLLLLKLSLLLPCSRRQLPQLLQLSPNSEHSDRLVARGVRRHRQNSIIPLGYQKRRAHLSRRFHHRRANCAKSLQEPDDGDSTTGGSPPV